MLLAAAGAVIPEEPAPEPAAAEERVPEGHVAVQSPVAANVWKLVASAGQKVEAGDQLMILEAMKMANDVRAPRPGQVHNVPVVPGQRIAKGDDAAAHVEAAARAHAAGIIPARVESLFVANPAER